MITGVLARLLPQQFSLCKFFADSGESKPRKPKAKRGKNSDSEGSSDFFPKKKKGPAKVLKNRSSDCLRVGFFSFLSLIWL